MLKTLSLSVAVMAIASSAWAQAASSAPSAQPASPEQVAIARAHADAIIAKANASDLFSNVTDGKLAAIRHNRSGMKCSFEIGDGSVTIFPGAPRGDDVSCNRRVGAIVVTTYATRFPERFTVDQMFAMSEQSLKQFHPTAKPYRGEVGKITVTGMEQLLPKVKQAYYLLETPPQAGQNKPVQHVSRLAVAMRGDWALKQRISGPTAEATTLSMLGETDMFTMLLDMLTQDLSAQAPAPAAAKPEGLSPPL